MGFFASVLSPTPLDNAKKDNFNSEFPMDLAGDNGLLKKYLGLIFSF